MLMESFSSERIQSKHEKFQNEKQIKGTIMSELGEYETFTGP